MNSVPYLTVAALLIVAVVTVAPLVLGASCAFAQDRTGIYFPLFTPPGPVWDNMLEYRKAHPSLPWIAVVDPHHGPGAHFDADYGQNIAKLQNQNVTVLGYVSTLWGARPADAIMQDIRNYHEWYRVDGIMLDEMVSDPGFEGHYFGLSQYAKSLGMKLVIGNVGTNISPTYVGTVDSIGTVEGDGTPPLSWLEGWHNEYDKRNFLYITYSQSWIDRDFVAESAKHVGSLYITDDTMPFPYDTFPSYFDEIVSVLDPRGDNSLRNLSVKSFDLLGNSLNGIMASIDNATDLRSLPFTYVSGQGSTHIVTALDNQTWTFDHWEDGSTNPSRAVMLDQSKVLRAYYKTPSNAALHSNIFVNALTVQGGQLHMGVTVSSGGSGMPGQTSFTPFSFDATDGNNNIYTVTAATGFGDLVFDHWENGSTNSSRQVTVQGNNAYLAAYYRYEKNSSLASLTVDSYTLDGTEVRGLWSAVSSPGGSSAGGYTPFTHMVNASSTTSYIISAQDSGIYAFDHWQDGTTNRTRTIVPSSDVTQSAYYRTPPATLNIRSADQFNNSLSGMYMTVAAINGTMMQSGYTNMTYIGNLGGVYTIGASDYRGMTFDHWQDGLTSRTRNVMLSAGNTEMVAYYKTAGTQRGLTPITFAEPQGPPSLVTVNAASLDGKPLGMWSLMNPEAAGSYVVTIHNYRGYTFSHWENGSTNSTRIVVVAVPAGQNAITAFFGLQGSN
ncbi:MAG: spherulation-specific family 4 protein [Nitrososphaera sp.]|jgi:hypothetical protein